MKFTRENAMQYLVKILPVWPSDEHVAALLTEQCARTGWRFALDASTQQWLYVLNHPLTLPITRENWEQCSALVYGSGNDAELDGDGDFAAMNQGYLCEKVDNQATPDGTPELAICQAGHRFAYLGHHPRDRDGELCCPNCMAGKLRGMEGMGFIGNLRGIVR